MIRGLVSIIIPNHGRDLTKVKQAIHASVYDRYEIIIVDSGKERSAQRNTGIDIAKGEFLLFLDSDMLIHPRTLIECVNCMRAGYTAVYIPEQIIDKGWFSRVRNWERQFYTATPVDVVRFVRAKGCPRFDETMNGPEDSDWDRQVSGARIEARNPYLHDEDVTFLSYFKKKAYYAKTMDKFIAKHPNDPILDWKWRCFLVFVERGKWKRLFNLPMTLSVMFILLLRGVIYKCRRH